MNGGLDPSVYIHGDRDSGVYEHLSAEDHTTINGHVNSEKRRNNSFSSAKGGISCSSSDSGSESTTDCTTDTDGSTNSDSPHLTGYHQNNTNNNIINSAKETIILQPPSYFKTRAMFYPTSEHAVNIETTLQEFIGSLFWVVESKRLDKSQEKLDRPPLLCAPFERKVSI